MRQRFLHWLVLLALHRRRLLLMIALAVTVILGAATSRLTLDVRWTNLLPDSLPVVREYRTIDHNFLQPANIIIAISGPDPVLLETITDEAADLLERELTCDASWSPERCKQEERYARHVYGRLPKRGSRNTRSESKNPGMSSASSMSSPTRACFPTSRG